MKCAKISNVLSSYIQFGSLVTVDLELFLLIHISPNITKKAAIIKETLSVSPSTSQPKNIVKMGLKKEKLATLDAG